MESGLEYLDGLKYSYFTPYRAKSTTNKKTGRMLKDQTSQNVPTSSLLLVY